MPIKFSDKAPKDSASLIINHFSETQISTKSGIRSFSEDEQISMSKGIQTYYLGLDEVENQISKNANAVDWKYLIIANESAVSLVHLNNQNKENTVSSVSYGPITAGLMEAFHVADKNSDIEKYNYEPRLLIAPGLKFSGLWLHSLDNHEDLIIPIPPNNTSLEDYKIITLDQLEKELQEIAKNVKQQIANAPNDSAGSGGFQNASLENLTHGIPKSISVTNINAATRKSLTATNIQLPLNMQYQQQTNWCWSAVATSVGLFYGTGNWTQCGTATGCLPGKNCCVSPASCNEYGFLNVSLTYTKSYSHAISNALPPELILNELQNGNPIGLRIAWYGGGAHFVAISGVYTISGSNLYTLTVKDSIYGTSTLRYRDFPGGYHGGGNWTHTYFCKKNGTGLPA